MTALSKVLNTMHFDVDIYYRIFQNFVKYISVTALFRILVRFVSSFSHLLLLENRI